MDEEKQSDHSGGVTMSASAPAFTPIARATPAPVTNAWRSKPNAYVMIDGEFGGPDWHLHPTYAWALVVFRKPVYPGNSWSMHDVVLGEKVVRITPEPGQTMARETREFWERNREVFEWVKRDTMPIRKAMRECVDFLKTFSAKYDLRFISKPAAIDIGRFQYCMTRYGGEDRVIPHRNTVCLATQLNTVCRTLKLAPDQLDGEFLKPTRDRLGMDHRPNHYPLEDCKLQIADFLALDGLMGKISLS